MSEIHGIGVPFLGSDQLEDKSQEIVFLFNLTILC